MAYSQTFVKEKNKQQNIVIKIVELSILIVLVYIKFLNSPKKIKSFAKTLIF